MDRTQLVFITGGSGYVGSHIVMQLLQTGYRVRAAARGAKVEELAALYASYGSRFEVISVADIATDQFPDALHGVDAVIHTAAPMPTRNDAQQMFSGAIEGTLNVLRQAERAGVKTIVVTSTAAAVRNSSGSTTDKDWNPVTMEQASRYTGMAAYGAAKTIAERELWAFADRHPHLEITSINPPFIYGPVAETFKIPEPSIGALSSLGIIYAIMFPEGTFPPNPHYADVRDVARAHVLALNGPPTASVGRKRLVFGSPHDLDFQTMREIVTKERPELASRWTRAPVPQYYSLKLQSDMKRLEEVLGLSAPDFHRVDETIRQSIESLLVLEENWVVRHGYQPHAPSIATNQ